MKEISKPENKLAERLSELITQKGVNKTELAKIAGVSPQSVNGWFKKGSISKASALKLSSHLDVSVAWLLGDEDRPAQNESMPPEEQRLLEAFRSLPPIERNNMLLAFEMRLQELKNFYSKYTKNS